MATLRVAIDARSAAEGAQEFEKATNRVKNSADKVGSTMSRLSSIMRMGGFTYLLNSVTDTATSMLKARRQGDNMFDAFLSGIPIVNRLASSANGLANELSGFSAAAEMAAKSNQIFKDMEGIRESLDRSLQLQAAGENAAAVQARFDFEDRLKQIETIEAQTDAIRKYNQQIDTQIELLKKSSTSFQNFGYGFGGGYVPLDNEALENQVRSLKGQKMVMPNLNVFKSAAGRETEFELERQTTAEIENEYELRYNQMKESKAREIKANEELQRSVIEDTRDQIDTVRHMEYLTRQEKIESLKEYQEAHADSLLKVSDAEKILNDEIIAYQQSRVDAMVAYNAELREDMEDSSLYISEKYAEAARSIEGSMSGAFQSMITGGASWKDAMTSFFSDVGNAFGRMASEMIARSIMMNAMSGIGGLFGGGPKVNAATPGAGGVHQARLGDVFDRGRVVPFAGGGVLDRPTYFPMADGKTGLAGEAGPEGFFPLRRRGGRLGLETSDQQKTDRPIEVHIRSIIVDDQRQAVIEEMKSKEGEKVFIQHAVRNRNLLR